MSELVYALSPRRFLGSVAASRDTLGKPPMKLLDVIDEVRSLTGDVPYAVVGGLAQILWAKKTHTDDLDVALAASDLGAAFARVRDRTAGARWSLPAPPDRHHEADDVFEVLHLLHEGVVVDLLTFRNEAFTREILSTAQPVEELGDVRFIRPELLLVTHLLRPGARAHLAAIELVLARRELGQLDIDYAEHWAASVDKTDALARALRRADEMELG